MSRQVSRGSAGEQARLQQYVNGENFEIFKLDLEKVDGEGNGTPLQYSCLENPVDGGAW